jgi:hypothetical protein
MFDAMCRLLKGSRIHSIRTLNFISGPFQCVHLLVVLKYGRTAGRVGHGKYGLLIGRILVSRASAVRLSRNAQLPRISVVSNYGGLELRRAMVLNIGPNMDIVDLPAGLNSLVV